MDFSEEFRNKYLVGEKTRMDLAKIILMSEVVPAMSGVNEVITQTFRTDLKTKKAECNFIQSCDYNIGQINQGINHILEPLGGGSPISQALEQAFDRLLTYVSNGDKKMIILITDGDENGEGDYTKIVKKIGSCECEVHIIGLDLDVPSKQKALLAAANANGTFTDIEVPEGSSFESVLANASQKLISLKLALNNFTSNKKSILFLTEEDTQLNEKIRIASEEALFHHLKLQHGDRVRWLNDPIEKGDDHDLEILERNSDKPVVYIECKGTPGNKPTFYLTANEWRLALKHGPKYELYFVQHCFGQPKFIQFTDLMVSLASGSLLPYSLDNEQLPPNRIALTVASI
jgi:hypothetical protein